MRQCPTELAEEIQEFGCLQCIQSAETCPEYCCLHIFEGSVETAAMVCAIDGCCLRIMWDGNGKSVFATEAMSSRARKGNTTYCDQIEGSGICQNCAFAVSANAKVDCPLGVAVPARDQRYESSLCYDFIEQNDTDAEIDSFDNSTGSTSGEVPATGFDPSALSSDEPHKDEVIIDGEVSTGYEEDPLESTPPAQHENPLNEETTTNPPRESEKATQSNGSSRVEGKPKKGSQKDTHSDESPASAVEGTTSRRSLDLIVGVVVGTLSLLLLLLCVSILCCCRKRKEGKNHFPAKSHILQYASTQHVPAANVQIPLQAKVLCRINSEFTEDGGSNGARTPYDTERPRSGL